MKKIRRFRIREKHVMNSLLENSCDLSDDDDEEIELLVEEGQTPILIRQKSKKSVKSSRDNSDFGFSNNSSKHFTLSDEDCESQSSERDFFPLELDAYHALLNLERKI